MVNYIMKVYPKVNRFRVGAIWSKGLKSQYKMSELKIPVSWTACINMRSCSQRREISNLEWRWNMTSYLWRSSQSIQKNPWVGSLPKEIKDWEKIFPPSPTLTWNTCYAWWNIRPNMLPVSQCDCSKWIFLLNASMLRFGRARHWNRSGSIL